MAGATSETVDVERAWRYYSHADTIQHERHGFMMVAQAMLFAAYAQRPEPGAVAYAALGLLFALIWHVQAERLSDGMQALSEKYLNGSSQDSRDPVYVDYMLGVDSRGGPSGRAALNAFLPWCVMVAWLCLGARAMLMKSPAPPHPPTCPPVLTQPR